jgi:hypothetical protein
VGWAQRDGRGIKILKEKNWSKPVYPGKEVDTTDLDLVPVVPLDGVDSDRDVRDRGDVSVMCLYPSPDINRLF